MEQRAPAAALLDHGATVGAVIAGVGHRINDPLAYVLTNVAVLHDLISKNGPAVVAPEAIEGVLACLAEIEEGVTRIAAVAKDLRVFTAVDDTRVTPVDLVRVCQAALGVCASRLHDAARVVCELEHVPPLATNEASLAMIVVELLVDAASAVEAKGTRDAEIRVRTGVDADRVFLEISRTAPLHDAAETDARRVRAIEALEGHVLTREVATGEGCVRASFPLRAIPRSKRPSPRASRVQGRRARVLLVDDEPTIGRALQRVLADEHDVTVVGGGRAALQCLAEMETFDVVFVDVMMPDVDGIDLYRTIVARHPSLAPRVVFITGGLCSERAERFVRESGRRCVEKPFTMEEVRDAVDDALRLPR